MFCNNYKYVEIIIYTFSNYNYYCNYIITFYRVYIWWPFLSKHQFSNILHKDKILKKFDNEYYINPNWINHVDSFINKIKNKEDFDLTSNQDKNLNYKDKKLNIKAIRFIPFTLNLKKEEIKNQFKIINENEESINFVDQDKNNYFLFNTGICVMCKEENH